MTDELNPVRCGCGGEAKTIQAFNKGWYVYCPECIMCSGFYPTEVEAITAWNRSMGARTVKVEDTWKIAGYDEINAWCPECEHRITRGCSYCPTCGVKLEWE